MAHLRSGPGSRLRLRLPAARIGLRLIAAAAAAALALSCVAAPADDVGASDEATPTPRATATAPTAASPLATAQPADTASPPCPDPCRAAPRTAGTFPLDAAPEASGLVASRRHDDVLYVLDDGPGTSRVLAVAADDRGLAGRIEIPGLDGTDTEALAAGPCGLSGGSCIYVGDIGDNTRSRDNVVVHRFAEPERLRGAAVRAEAAALHYPDGPHDAEALLVDASGRIGIVTKAAGDDGSGAARLFVAPRFGDGELTDGGRVDLPTPGLPLAAAALGNVVTGGDWTPGRVALRTYDAVFEFRSPSGRGGVRNFARWPVREVDAAAEQQGEAVAYGTDGCSLYTVSEGSPAVSAALCR